MRKIFFIFIIFVLTGCTSGHVQEADIPVPNIIFTETAIPRQVSQEEEAFAQIDPDIPQFNEFHISLEFEPETRTIHGIESVRYTNRSQETLERLAFRAFLNDMDIHHVFWDNEELNFDLQETALDIELPRELEPEETIQIRIQFEAYIPLGTGIIGANQYAAWAGAFLPADNMFMLDIVNYVVEITTPIGYVVAGTGIKSEEYLEDRKTTSFVAPMARNFAFAISPFFHIETRTTSSDREIRLYHYSENIHAELILDRAEEAMTIFEDAIGSYPFPQISIVETDIFRNGESFSNVMFINSSATRRVGGLDGLQVGVGRQWFSIIIGNNSAEEAWLSDGLITFILYNQQSLTNEYMLQYRIVIHALLQELGTEAFNELLREYFRQFAFRTAGVEDFIALAEEIHDRDLQSFFMYWLNFIRHLENN